MREVTRDHRCEGGPRERRLAREHFVRHAPQAVDIAAGSTEPSPNACSGLIYAAVSDRHSCAGQALGPGGINRPRDAEVRDKRVPRLEEDVFRLDVAVDHAGFVRSRQRLPHLRHEPHDLLDRELPLPSHSVAESFTLQVRHDEIQQPIRFAGVEQRQDVGVRDPGRSPDLP